jgi:hypothetical protein
VHGLKEYDRACRDIAKDLSKELRAELKKLAEPVAQDARSRLQRFRGSVASGVVPGSRAGTAVVRQRNRKVTGLRPDFGVLQMQVGLIPALDANEAHIIDGVEHLIDHIGDRHGF